ncbi:uncharacterized protein LOC106024252 [Esox lucius]|uniref:Fibronectin type-III domain-containing protein n=1 Tax=Esox lucius TaxID=8010 RepID=A0A6Q2WWC0_ESOLU|nr:uncharacterized protein LOC106024252 [Esox lucius]
MGGRLPLMRKPVSEMTECDNVVELACLGRPFRLGMLYDRRNDSLIPGVTLWDNEDLQNNTDDRPQQNTEFEIIASDSIEDKSSALNVEASLKASFMAGLVKVEGSAKYLNDTKVSKKQARVTLKYKTTTSFRQLTMNHLGRGNVKYPHVFEDDTATHVVTGILYGAQAFFVFDREVTDTKDCQNVKGNLEMVIKKLINIEGQGSLKMNNTDNSHIEKFSCKFHGDFSLENNPTSFQEAMSVYQSLPKLLGGKGEHAVPLQVWLYPLKKLDSAAAQVIRQISIGLVMQAQTVLEHFTEMDMRCNDVMKNKVLQCFPEIAKKIISFKEICLEYKLNLQKTLSIKLQCIRGEGENESVLAEILRRSQHSPFSRKLLSEWMDCKEREINVLESFMKMMKDIKVVSSKGELDQNILNPDHKHAVCFAFTLLDSEEPYLTVLSDYLRDPTRSENRQDSEPYRDDVEKEQWYNSREVSNTMREQAKLFMDFADAHKDNKAIRFMVAAITNKKHKGASIYLFNDGSEITNNFEPPSKPEKPTACDITHDSVTINIHFPRFGSQDVTHYLVEYCVDGKDVWSQEKASRDDQTFTVSSLSPNTLYRFKYRAVCSVGQGPSSDISDIIKTLPTNPPGEPTVRSRSNIFTVHCQKPSIIGEGVSIENYIIEYRPESPGSTVDKSEWRKKTSPEEMCIIPGLQPNTEYTVRVRCDCGQAGRSKDSMSVTVCFKGYMSLAESIQLESQQLSPGPPSVYMIPLTEEDVHIDGCKRYRFGEENKVLNRTIMVLGSTGAGKTTLINGMINYILGVKWTDEIRFKMIDEGQSKSQAESQTSLVTAYKIYHQEHFQVPYSVTIVDTPGFGDTRGIERDRMLTGQIHNMFTSQKGVTEIDAVCFVTQASLARLTATQKYVFESVLSIFGKDIADNIRVLVTFADGQQPPVLEAIKNSEIPCPKTKQGLPVHFKFNNSALFADNTMTSSSKTCAAKDEDEDDEDDNVQNFDEMFWSMGVSSMKKFFSAVNKLETKSLVLTKEVLKERKQLETAVEGLQPQVNAGLAKLEEISQTTRIIEKHEADITANKDFEYELDITKAEKIDISGTGTFITNCQQCNVTCHYPCYIPDDNLKINCAAMTNGQCRVCPGKCIWNVHFNMKYRLEYTTVTEKRTYEELKEKYQSATEARMSDEEVIKKLKDDYENLQSMVNDLINQSAKCLARLKEIALKPNPLSTLDYIDMLIEGEKTELKPGYMARIRGLEKIKFQERFKLGMDKTELLPLDDNGKTTTKTKQGGVETEKPNWIFKKFKGFKDYFKHNDE